MKSQLALASFAFSLVVGCAAPPKAVSPRLPYFAMYKPPPPGRDTIFLLAAGTSRIWIDRDCVLIGSPRAGYSLPIFYQGTTVGRDSRGLYLRDAENGLKFRDGDKVRVGGGESPFKGRDLDRWLVQPIPEVCLARTDGSAGSVNPGMTRA